MRPDELWTEPPGHKPLVVNVIVVGPFEEEEEGTGVASDVVKVQGEDPDTPGYLRGDRVRPLPFNNSWNQKTEFRNPRLNSRLLVPFNQPGFDRIGGAVKRRTLCFEQWVTSRLQRHD